MNFIADRLKGADRAELTRLQRLYPNNEPLQRAIERAQRRLPAPLVPTAKPPKTTAKPPKPYTK